MINTDSWIIPSQARTACPVGSLVYPCRLAGVVSTAATEAPAHAQSEADAPPPRSPSRLLRSKPAARCMSRFDCRRLPAACRDLRLTFFDQGAIVFPHPARDRRSRPAGRDPAHGAAGKGPPDRRVGGRRPAACPESALRDSAGEVRRGDPDGGPAPRPPRPERPRAHPPRAGGAEADLRIRQPVAALAGGLPDPRAGRNERPLRHRRVFNGELQSTTPVPISGPRPGIPCMRPPPGWCA